VSEDLKVLHDSLVRRHLGKRGIHGLNVDPETRTLNVYMDDTADAVDVIKKLRKDSGDLKIRTIRSRRGRLA
jgi:hypothetical protein